MEADNDGHDAPADPDWMAGMRAREVGGPQGSDDWHRERSWRYTASVAAQIIGDSDYGDEASLWDEKLGRVPRKSRKVSGINQFAAWRMARGTFYEHQACARYALQRGVDVHHMDLCVHPNYEWLAASPDGVTSDRVLVEIKVPSSRKIIPGVVPRHIMPQLQVCMEVLDLDIAHLVQYEPPSTPDGDDWVLDITEVARDAKWWRIKGAILRASYEEFQRERAMTPAEVLERAWRGGCSRGRTAAARAPSGPRAPGMLMAGLGGWDGSAAAFCPTPEETA